MGDWFEKQTIGLLPERAAERWGAREALAFQGKRWTFADVHADVVAAAKGLLHLGIAPGDKVALWMVNRPEWLHAMYAIMQIGAVLVPVNTRFRTDDVAYVLGQSDAVAVVLGDRSGPVAYLGMMREVASGLGARPDARFPALRHVIALSDRAHADTIGWREMLEDGRRVSDDALRERARAIDPGDKRLRLLHVGYHRLPQGRCARPSHHPEHADMADRMGVTARRRDPHVSAALSRLRLHLWRAHVDDHAARARC